MTGARTEIRGRGFLNNEVVARLAARTGINQPLVQVFADTVQFAAALISNLEITKHETSDEKQKVIALVMLVRLVEIAESIFILAAYGVRQDLRSLFRVFLDAYFLIANICSDAAFVPVYFGTDVHARLKLMRGAAKRDDELFKELNEYATADLQSELDRKIKQERVEAFNSFAFAEKVGCGNIYDSMYRICSASVHTTPRCLEEYVETDANDNIVVIIHTGDNESTHRALSDTQHLLVKALRGVCEVFALKEDAALAALDARNEAATDDQRP